MLSKATEYALRALIYIWVKNSSDQRAGFREISSEIEAPEQYTAKILQQLVKMGIISSVKGRGGGFYFENGRQKITVYEIIKIFEGEEYFTRCGLGLSWCNPKNPCPMHDEYDKIRSNFLAMVVNESIASLAQKVTDGDAVLGRQAEKKFPFNSGMDFNREA